MAGSRRHRRTTILVVIALVIAPTLLGACSDRAGDPLAASFDGQWVLVEGSGPAGVVELDVGSDEPIEVTLNIDGRSWTGTAACNAYNGMVDSSGGTIDTGSGFVATEMGCDPPELMAAESAYLAALAEVDEGHLTTATDAHDALTLSGPEALLRFTRAPEGRPESDAR
jgi:heat shock protein HslJ